MIFSFFLNVIVNDMMMMDAMGWPYDSSDTLLFRPTNSFAFCLFEEKIIQTLTQTNLQVWIVRKKITNSN